MSDEPSIPSAAAAPAAPATPHEASAPPRTVAVIDIGATAVRMEIAEISADGAIRTLDALRQPVHLGRDTFTLHRIQQSTIEECVKVLKGFRRVMEEYGVTEPGRIRAVATSSVREAQNREMFLDRIYMATRINVEAIEETEETRLTYLAVQHFLRQEPELARGDALVVEVGGGDTELLLMHDGYVAYANTYRLGTLRMQEHLGTRDASAQQSAAVLGKHIHLMTEQIRRSVPAGRIPHLIAVSGDARFAAAQLCRDWSERDLGRIDVKAFAGLARKIAPLGADALVKKYRIAFQEAETLGPSLQAYAQLAKAFGVEHIFVPKASLRQGLLQEVSSGGAWTADFQDQVVHSALALGAKYALDEKHGQQVADLSVRLFRELQPEHQLDARFELLLRLAALLHEIGLFVNTRSHHKHSMYVVLNSDLFGMSRHSMLLIALVARYHRRAMPQAYHEGYALLGRDDRLAVSKMAAILRIADALDRNHMQQVRELSFSREGSQFVIAIHDVEDLTLERLALKEKGTMFEEVYGMKIALRSTSRPEAFMPDV
jgi:exopolyphosphatase / guanosine-5'-triphosphate,3'-diphosphate pyrophosphatase